MYCLFKKKKFIFTASGSLLCATLIGGAFGLYSARDGVIELTSANFKSEVLKDDSIWIVEFYAPW